jgi:probable addiction module antidote protein
MLTKKHDDFRAESLQDPDEIQAYLNVALEDAFEKSDFRFFLLALRDVAMAKGMRETASKAKLNRESLYRMLSEKGNPELSSLCALLKTMGLKLSVTA